MTPISMKSKINFVILLSFLSSCSQVPIKNTEWCGDLGQYGASCFNTDNEETRDIPLPEWNEERFGMLCTNAKNFSEWKKVILKLCKLPGARCTYADRQKAHKVEEKIETFIIKVDGIPELIP